MALARISFPRPKSHYNSSAGRRWLSRATARVDSLRLEAPVARRISVSVPGDKSITHRALLLSAIAQGTTFVVNANSGADALSTYAALRRLGVRIQKRRGGFVVRGSNSLRDPRSVLDCGNSGTTMRLLMGLLAGRVNAVLDGDASLRRRPMRRVAVPLHAMGADVKISSRGTPPVRIRRGAEQLNGLTYRLPVASAQLKSALLLAGLSATGRTVLHFRERSRDHTERMLRLMRAKLTLGARRIELWPSLLHSPKSIHVPGDFSAAFYLVAAAATLPGMLLCVKDVGLNPTRTAALDVLRAMGACIRIKNRRQRDGEPSGDLIVSGGAPLRAVTVKKSLVPNLLDEIPALCAVAALARGTFRVRGASELRVKESDRVAATVDLLQSFKVDALALRDGLVVRGGKMLMAPRSTTTHGDHRIGMAAAILSVAACAPVVINDAGCIATSYPDFAKTWRAIFAPAKATGESFKANRVARV